MISALLVDARLPRFAFSQHAAMPFNKGPDERGPGFSSPDEMCQFIEKTAVGMQEHAVKPDMKNSVSCPGRDHAGGIVGNPEGNFFARCLLQMVFQHFLGKTEWQRQLIFVLHTFITNGLTI